MAGWTKKILISSLSLDPAHTSELSFGQESFVDCFIHNSWSSIHFFPLILGKINPSLFRNMRVAQQPEWEQPPSKSEDQSLLSFRICSDAGLRITCMHLSLFKAVIIKLCYSTVNFELRFFLGEIFSQLTWMWIGRICVPSLSCSGSYINSTDPHSAALSSLARQVAWELRWLWIKDASL